MRPPRDGRSDPGRAGPVVAATGGEEARSLGPANDRRRRATAWPAQWWWETGPDLRYTFLSAGFDDAAAADRHALIGRPLLQDHQPGEAPAPGAADARQAIAARAPFRDLRCRGVGRDGGARFWLIAGGPVVDRAGDFRGYRGSGCDVTSIVGSPQPVTAAQAAFMAYASRELRTPLNVILGFSELLADAPGGETQGPGSREYAGYIHGAAAHLLAVVDGIIDLSRIESGHVALEDQPLDLGEVIRAVCRLMQERATRNGLRFEARIADPLPHLLADERAIMQILTNLVSNAMKFTPPHGDVRIEAALAAAGADPGGVVIGVHDTGIGIAEHDIPIALAPFGQVAAALRPQDRGAGLGLPLTSRLVEMHQGTLQIRSAPGVGTSVLIWLPAARVLPARAADAGRGTRR
jgi:signal transduction histidine kinase